MRGGYYGYYYYFTEDEKEAQTVAAGLLEDTLVLSDRGGLILGVLTSNPRKWHNFIAL